MGTVGCTTDVTTDLEQLTGAIVAAASATAERFRAGGSLLVVGTGASASDAHHVAVEFVHPVIVGKRALPARALAGTASPLRPGPGDIVLVVSAGDPPAPVLDALEAAAASRSLSIALVDRRAARAVRADHVLAAGGHVPTVKERHVTAYHLLWEATHAFLDHSPAGGGEEREATGFLYPFLDGGGHDAAALHDEVEASVRAKLAETAAVRAASEERNADAVGAAAARIADAAGAGRRIFTFGNGGSSTDAAAVAQLLGSHAGVDAVDLTADPAVITALTNDAGFDVVFARQLRALGQPGDVAIGLSTSGGSANVLAAFAEARRMGLVTIGLAGYGGGGMTTADLDVLLAVDSSSVHRIQEAQTTLYVRLLERVALGR